MHALPGGLNPINDQLDATPLVVDICVNIDQFRQARHGLLYLWQPLFKHGQFAAQQAVVVRARTVLAPPHQDVLLRYQCQSSEEPTSELPSLMRISSAIFCLKKKNHTN